MVAVNWSLNDYEAATGGIEPVPTGWYDVIITNTKLENIKSGNGQRLDIYFKIISGEYNGQMAFASCNWLNSSEQATQIGRGQIKSLVLAAGIDPNTFMDTQMLHDRPLKVRLRFEEPNDPKYSGSNAVSGAKPIQGEQQPGYSAQPQVPAQQPQAPQFPQQQAQTAPQYQPQPQTPAAPQPVAAPHYDPASQPVFNNNGAPQPPFIATSGQTPASQQQPPQPAQAPAPTAPPAMPPFLEGQQNQASAQQQPANPAPVQQQAVSQQAQQVAQPGQPGQNGGAPVLPWTHPQQ